jgi:hypothetical protein
MKANEFPMVQVQIRKDLLHQGNLCLLFSGFSSCKHRPEAIQSIWLKNGRRDNIYAVDR